MIAEAVRQGFFGTQNRKAQNIYVNWDKQKKSKLKQLQGIKTGTIWDKLKNRGRKKQNF